MMKADDFVELHDTEISVQDIIISRYENGEITKEQAWAEIQTVTEDDYLFFWDIELHLAEEIIEHEAVMKANRGLQPQQSKLLN